MFSILLLSSVIFSQIVLPVGHPVITDVLKAGTKPPANHPLINGMLGLSGHTNVDEAMKAGTKLPGGHPEIEKRFTYSKATTPPPGGLPAAGAGTPPPTVSAPPVNVPKVTSTTAKPVVSTKPIVSAGAGTGTGVGTKGPGGYTAIPPPTPADDCQEPPIGTPTGSGPILTASPSAGPVYPSSAVAPVAVSTPTAPTYSSGNGLEIGLAWLVLLW